MTFVFRWDCSTCIRFCLHLYAYMSACECTFCLKRLSLLQNLNEFKLKIEQFVFHFGYVRWHVHEISFKSHINTHSFKMLSQFGIRQMHWLCHGTCHVIVVLLTMYVVRYSFTFRLKRKQSLLTEFHKPFSYIQFRYVYIHALAILYIVDLCMYDSCALQNWNAELLSV